MDLDVELSALAVQEGRVFPPTFCGDCSSIHRLAARRLFCAGT
ncbi:hypothetical protein [Streptomyces sp. NBC_01294]|nr:hypothetical protein [Streptomyces sp. NBC_01294]WRZ58486.1 hypothetical protein OG534_19520 [Streptomyces sp. NBC_01294]